MAERVTRQRQRRRVASWRQAGGRELAKGDVARLGLVVLVSPGEATRPVRTLHGTVSESVPAESLCSP
jgi:hypothetical protein